MDEYILTDLYILVAALKKAIMKYKIADFPPFPEFLALLVHCAKVVKTQLFATANIEAKLLN